MSFHCFSFIFVVFFWRMDSASERKLLPAAAGSFSLFFWIFFWEGLPPIPPIRWQMDPAAASSVFRRRPAIQSRSSVAAVYPEARESHRDFLLFCFFFLLFFLFLSVVLLGPFTYGGGGWCRHLAAAGGTRCPRRHPKWSHPFER